MDVAEVGVSKRQTHGWGMRRGAYREVLVLSGSIRRSSVAGASCEACPCEDGPETLKNIVRGQFAICLIQMLR